MPIDVARAQADAKALNEAGPRKWGTDEQTFTAIFSLKSQPQLRVTFEEFRKLTGRDMEPVIRSEMSGDLMNTFLAIGEDINQEIKTESKSNQNGISLCVFFIFCYSANSEKQAYVLCGATSQFNGGCRNQR